MADEEKNVSGTETSEDNADYISALNEMKQNTVSKDKYEQLKEENKRLLKSLVNGEQLPAEQMQPKESIDEIRNRLFNHSENESNLEYVQDALKLREAVMAAGQPDPFLPYGKKILPTDDDIATAKRVARVLQECVDYADGDSLVFTNELQRRTVDTGKPARHN